MKHSIMILLLCLSLCTGCSGIPEHADRSGKQASMQPDSSLSETSEFVQLDESDTSTQTESSQDPASSSHPMTVLPVNTALELTNPMPDGTYAVSFDRSGLRNIDGTWILTAEVYDYDRYRAADIAQLQVGDTIQCCGEAIPITSLDSRADTATGDVYVMVINGGMDCGGISLLSNTSRDTYRTFTFDDHPGYYSLGTLDFVLSHDIVLSDQGDDPSTQSVISTFDALPDWICAVRPNYFSEYSTTLTVQNGVVVAITRHYIP